MRAPRVWPARSIPTPRDVAPEALPTAALPAPHSSTVFSSALHGVASVSRVPLARGPCETFFPGLLLSMKFSITHSSHAALLAAVALSTSAAALAQTARTELRIGSQKSASLFVLQKAQGTLEKRLAALNVGIRWVEFPAGPQLLEGLNVGSVDVGYVGEAPPVFAQAAGANFIYIGHDPAAPEAEAIFVPKDSPLKTVADLKGKKIALDKGSNVHYLLVRALENTGLNYGDVRPVFLAPADARARTGRPRSRSRKNSCSTGCCNSPRPSPFPSPRSRCAGPFDPFHIHFKEETP